MKILITGGAGFISRNLAEQFRGEHALSPLGRRDLDLSDSDRVFECLRSNKFDVVIHTATYDAAPRHSTKDPALVLVNNLRMFFNLVRGRAHFGKMIFFGSGAEFDRRHWKPRMGEDYFDEHVPSDQYGFSKYIMTKYALKQDNIYNLRLFGVFGKYDDWRTRFIPNACCHAALGLPIRMDQNKLRDFLHADDLVRIVKWFMNHSPREKVYNVCSGRVFEYERIARTIIEISGKNLELAVKSGGLGQDYSGDNARLRNEIAGLEFTPFDESLEALYRWHDANKQEIRADQL